MWKLKNKQNPELFILMIASHGVFSGTKSWTKTWSHRAERWGLSHRCSLRPLGRWRGWSHLPGRFELQRGQPSQRRSRLFEDGEGHYRGDHQSRLRKFHSFACRPRSSLILKEQDKVGQVKKKKRYVFRGNKIQKYMIIYTYYICIKKQNIEYLLKTLEGFINTETIWIQTNSESNI